MKANELMIGDWVYAIDGDRKKHPCRIATLEYDSPNKRDDFSIDFYGTDYEVEWPDVAFEIEPIPLTPEILEKNGFVYNELPFAQSWEKFGLALTIGGNGYRINCGANVALIIDSVHQLQHALRLCGIDKEIML